MGEDLPHGAPRPRGTRPRSWPSAWPSTAPTMRTPAATRSRATGAYGPPRRPSLSSALTHPAAPAESPGTPAWVITHPGETVDLIELDGDLRRRRMPLRHADIGGRQHVPVLVGDRLRVDESPTFDDLAVLNREPHPRGAVRRLDLHADETGAADPHVHPRDEDGGAVGAVPRPSCAPTVVLPHWWIRPSPSVRDLSRARASQVGSTVQATSRSGR